MSHDENDAPDAPGAADAPAPDALAPESPETAEAVQSPEAADAPEASESSEVAEASETSEVAEASEVPETVDERPRLATEQLKAIIEALVFASPEPLTPRTLFKVLSDEPKEDVQAALAALEADYEQRGGGLHLVRVAGGYQITSRPELHDWMRRLFHERTTQKLSVASLETLSVVAYRQPVTAAEITEIRGVNTSGVLSTLLERHLIKIVGRKNVVGRPFLYGTTREFLIRFGLKDLADLPRIEDMVQALGFDPPALLVEKPIEEDMLPLEEGDDGFDGGTEGESAPVSDASDDDPNPSA
ncbi:MAG: SMC-Scp complex subunit ScpB [Vicinamibacterales bacterium]|nr:SMC-Scp complex subunit ScpB [Vicinamibacterales bacterium]